MYSYTIYVMFEAWLRQNGIYQSLETYAQSFIGAPLSQSNINEISTQLTEALRTAMHQVEYGSDIYNEYNPYAYIIYNPIYPDMLDIKVSLTQKETTPTYLKDYESEHYEQLKSQVHELAKNIM